MKIISIFNNKGGVGKTTLTHHLAHILADMGKKVLIIDLDPQCNISLYNLQESELEKIWKAEDDIIDNGLESTRKNMQDSEYLKLLKETRTAHFILMPIEEGQSDFKEFPPPMQLNENLGLIPGRLTLYKFESKIADRWNGLFLGESLSIRTVISIRHIAEVYAEKYNYDFVIVDTSPSLGMLNKIIVSTVDGFIIPCLPSMLSLYGIKNIGQTLTKWKRDFDTCYLVLPDDKRKQFPESFARFLGYTIYNANKDSHSSRQKEWYLTKSHYTYAQKIPEYIEQYIASDVRKHLSLDMTKEPIGGEHVMHKHKYFLSNNAQELKKPIWELPNLKNAESEGIKTNYKEFAKQFLERVETLND